MSASASEGENERKRKRAQAQASASASESERKRKRVQAKASASESERKRKHMNSKQRNYGLYTILTGDVTTLHHRGTHRKSKALFHQGFDEEAFSRLNLRKKHAVQ